MNWNCRIDRIELLDMAIAGCYVVENRSKRSPMHEYRRRCKKAMDELVASMPEHPDDGVLEMWCECGCNGKGTI